MINPWSTDVQAAAMRARMQARQDLRSANPAVAKAARETLERADNPRSMAEFLAKERADAVRHLRFDLADDCATVAGRVGGQWVGVVARAGVQQYEHGREIRLPEDLFAPATMRSAEGAPVTIGHTTPPHRPEAHGYLRNVRRDGDHMVADLVSLSADAVRAIQVGGMRELSLGYMCKVSRYDGPEAETRATDIKIHECAIVPKGRCGAACCIR